MPPGKARGGSPYNQFDIIQGDPLGGHAGPAGDSWLPAKSPPTNKIGSKSSNASWPPGITWGQGLCPTFIVDVLGSFLSNHCKERIWLAFHVFFFLMSCILRHRC